MQREQQKQWGEQLAHTLGDAVPAQDPRRSPGKPIIRWYQQLPSEPCWDVTLEAACKLNKYYNMFVRQLY